MKKTLPSLASPPWLVACSLALWLWAGTSSTRGQTIHGHQIAGISVNPSGDVALTLAGTPALPFQRYFDLFPLEVSSDLATWIPLATVVRTNVTNAVTFVDPIPARASARFYRTPTNQFSTALPAPTGVHAVGRLSRMLTDASRTNRFRIRTNSSFMVTVWYPAQPGSGAAPSPYLDRPLAERSAYWGTANTNRIAALVQLAAPAVPVAAEPARFPVVFYSHGLGDQSGRGVRTENSERMEELSSHGYVVIAMDHTDTYATVFPPDRLVLGGNAWSFDFAGDRLRDVTFLLDYVTQMNVDDPLFAGRLDLDRLGIMGWSMGGGTAAEAGRLQDRLKAVVLLDAYLGAVPTVLTKGLSKPFLAMNSPSSGLDGDSSTLFNKATKDAYKLTIQGADHEGFTDSTAWLVNPTAATRRRALAMNACVVSFFDKYLRGVDDRLLENPGATRPDVILFRRK